MVASVNGQLTASVLSLLGVGSKNIGRSISALSSGNRLVSASTDVAALSVATGLQTQVSSLRTAQLNITQAQSFLQVADGGLSQTSAILDRMQALTVQSNSGALSNSARVGLNTEFQQLREELDRLSGNTNFNGINLLDGSLSNSSTVKTDATAGTQATGALNFTANLTAGQTINLDGNTLVAGTDFAIGGTAQNTVANIADALNNDSRFEGFTFGANGNQLTIEADAAGEAGNQFTINRAASTAAFTVNGDALSTPNLFTLSGGTNDGLSSGDTSVAGTVSNSLVSGATGSKANTQLQFNTASDIQAGNTISIANGEGGNTTFTFVNGTPVGPNQVQIGGTLEETLQNTANAINNYTGADDYGVRQLTATVDGNTLNLTANQDGDATGVTGTPLTVALGTTGGNLSRTTLDNGTTGGVDVSGVTNGAFLGSVQGFSATYQGPNSITASIKVGNETYTADISNTAPGTDTTVRFESANGGFFDVTLAGGQGQAVNDQAGADSFANRLDASFAGLNFSQNRDVTNFTPNAQLFGSSLTLDSNNFNNLKFDGVEVQSGIGGTGAISVSINGETYRANNLGKSIGAGESITLTSGNNRTITFTNGVNELDLSTNAGAQTFEDSFRQSLGIPGGEGASFQIGATASQTRELTIGDTSSRSLFNGEDIDILTADGAARAFGLVRSALDYVTGQRATVGSAQSALDYSFAEVESAIQNQEAARASLADTDIASESTSLAQETLRRQLQIASLVQGNRLNGSLLNLLSN